MYLHIYIHVYIRTWEYILTSKLHAWSSYLTSIFYFQSPVSIVFRCISFIYMYVYAILSRKSICTAHVRLLQLLSALTLYICCKVAIGYCNIMLIAMSVEVCAEALVYKYGGTIVRFIYRCEIFVNGKFSLVLYSNQN